MPKARLVRLTEKQAARWQRAAKRAGITVPQLIRDATDRWCDMAEDK